ncbi:YhcB family protein [Ostreibacterium oceani]|uniref:Z-ring associated protein G n=1 Tax=Ostreibacterium oceani TaxID=2654998 RepID=A0A6N7ETN9_9GAMM|nr:DUF1043 family protein [Ostreibacterium oceani]MPV85792.1 DUF1043 family protein [Ostreibacterium oceani]
MNQELLLALVAAVALIIGFIIGKMVGSKSKNNPATQKAQEELEAYQKAVSEHFGKTADLIDDLTQSYKKVFDHLGESAHTLLNEDEVNTHIASRASKTITLSYQPNSQKQPPSNSQSDHATPASSPAAGAASGAATADKVVNNTKQQPKSESDLDAMPLDKTPSDKANSDKANSDKANSDKAHSNKAAPDTRNTKIDGTNTASNNEPKNADRNDDKNNDKSDDNSQTKHSK